MAKKANKHTTASPVLSLFDLHDRVAVVTGGAGLLGEEFCHTLAQAGARVVIADLNKAAAAKIAKQINTTAQMGTAALAVETDVTDPASVQAMVAATLQAFGRLDILVNSAALDP
ncbi:MAG: SDR family NAD(P)-dependent oxidoreductase, partial [Anaerolineales bacterium]|nr:SDR family NAD(P)-dependent oxidoreductase [Anaerolineales bacterium]